MQVIIEIPKTEEQLRRVWGMDFKPTKSIEQEPHESEENEHGRYRAGYKNT